jgi:hypothetical protein
VASSHIILLYCADGIPPSPNALKFTIFSLDPTAIQPLAFQITSERFSADDISWIILQLDSATLALQGGKKYRLVYRPPDASEDKTIDVDTSPTAPLTLRTIDTDQRIFDLKSHVAFQVPKPGARQVTLHQFAGESDDLSVTSYSETGFLPLHASTEQIRMIDPGDLGRLRITLSQGITGSQQIAIELKGMVDIFGQETKVDPGSRVKLSQAPSTRDAAYCYFKVDYAAGVDAKPAWVFDGKIAPPIGRPFGGWQFAPDLEADIGSNAISGIKYTDTVDLGATASRGERIDSFLEYVYMTAGTIQYAGSEVEPGTQL